MEMRLNSDDIARLIRACEMYKDYTGSEYMWEEYDRLEKKLMYYEEENCVEDQVYREPHLQRKSDQCAILWREWFNYKYGLKDKEKATEYRALWCQCCDEFGVMVSQEVKTNPRYNRLQIELKKEEPPR